MVSGSDDKTLRVWDLQTGLCEWVCVGHASDVNALAVIDTRMFASAASDRTIRLWDCVTRECVVFQGHMDAVITLACLPDGRLASGSWDNTVRVWNRDGTVFKTHVCDGRVGALVVTRDGQLVSGSDKVRFH